MINNKGISIYLKASPNCLATRLKKETQNRPLIANVTETELIPYIKKELQKRSPFYELAHHSILVDEKSTNEILREINTLVRPL